VKSMELIWKIEAILFSAGEKVPVSQLAKLARASEEDVLSVLSDLREKYAAKESSLAIFDDGDSWKLTVKESYLPLVRKIVSRTELSKTIMETLAVVAWKSPIKQSDLVDIRSNKAYEHVKELVESGFIIKERTGRTYILKLTQKFFDYFELNSEKEIQKRFEKFEELEKAIVPQKHMQDFEPKDPEQEKQEKAEEFVKENQELGESISKQIKEDDGFLKEMDSRISQVGEESAKTTQEFSEMMPTAEEESDSEEGSEGDSEPENKVPEESSTQEVPKQE